MRLDNGYKTKFCGFDTNFLNTAYKSQYCRKRALVSSCMFA